MEEEDENHQGGQLCKFPRLENTEELEDGGGGGGFNSNNWHHSSRIIRVSRASGGKDRHSKVMTSKGLRDRRVRLSVTTAIQFYDLQDRLGYDQPSKAVEWLIKSASDAISELPSLNTTFPDTPKQPSDEKRGFDSADAQVVVENEKNMIINYQQNQNQNVCLSKSGCSSNNSETSKGCGLTLARTDIRVNRVKARERARERTAKEKEKEVKEMNEVVVASQSHGNSNNIAHQTASFTELLTGGMNNTNSTPRGSVSGHHHQIQGDEARQQWSSTPMDYFSPMLLGASSRIMSPLLSQNIQLGHSHSLSEHHQTMSVSPFNNYSFTPHDHHNQHHLMPAASSNEYNLNFTISSSSSGLAGYNRGTLQSNSLSLLPHHLQRFSSLDHGSSSSSSSSSSTLPFFMGHGIAAAAAQPSPAAPSTNTNTMENNQHHHHQFSSPFDANRLHLCYGDACRHSDQKGKPKN